MKPTLNMKVQGQRAVWTAGLLVAMGSLLTLALVGRGSKDKAREHGVPTVSLPNRQPEPLDGPRPAPVEQPAARTPVEPSENGEREPGTPEPATQGVAPPADLAGVLDRLRRMGIHAPETMPDAEAWRFLAALWDDLNKVRTNARMEYFDLGKRLAEERLASGDYVAFAPNEFPAHRNREPVRVDRPEEIQQKAPWYHREHPDDWITVQHTTKDGKPVIKYVHIGVGEHQGLDQKREEFHFWDHAIRSELREFLSRYRQPHQNKESVR